MYNVVVHTYACRVPECLTSIKSLTVLMMNDCSLPRLPTEIGRSASSTAASLLLILNVVGNMYSYSNPSMSVSVDGLSE